MWVAIVYLLACVFFGGGGDFTFFILMKAPSFIQAIREIVFLIFSILSIDPFFFKFWKTSNLLKTQNRRSTTVTQHIPQICDLENAPSGAVKEGRKIKYFSYIVFSCWPWCFHFLYPFCFEGFQGGFKGFRHYQELVSLTYKMENSYHSGIILIRDF